MHNDTTTTESNQVKSKQSNRDLTRPFLGIAMATLIAGGAFFSGLQVGSFADDNDRPVSISTLLAGEAQPPSDVDLSEFWNVWQLLEEKFAIASGTTPLTTEQKVQGAIDGLVGAYGDPYTAYLPPKEAEQFNADIAGNFSGVGMEVGMRNNVITVIAPLPGTPAEKAGIMAGDYLIKINGTSTERMGVDEAVGLIRGEEGTEVTLSVVRNGLIEPLDIKIIRAKIEVPTIKTEKRGDTFVVSLYSFNALAETKMQEALREYIKSGADNMVLDLRGNPGGYLQSAVAIASYFLPAGKVVLRESFGDEREEELYRSQGRTLKQFAPKELVVLIDGGSASASEILAGALQEHGYATLVGVPSFGKGSVQELVDLNDGSSVKITIARWLTPNGTTISNGGLKPDITVERTLEDRESSIDPQLDAALAVIAGTYVAPIATTTPQN